MLGNIMTVAEQVIILFIIMAVGVVCTKAGVIKEEFVKGLTKFIITIVTPCSIISSFQREYNSELFTSLMISIGLAILFTIVCIVVTNLTVRTKDERQRGVARFAVIFTNSGYMGLPLQQAVLGSIGVFYGAAYLAGFHMFIWSYGIVAISGDRKNLKLKKILLCPPLISVVIGLVLFFTSCPLPEVISSPIASLGAMNSVLPMIVMGYYLANTDFGKLFRNKLVYWGTAVRNIISPLIILGILLLLGIKGDMMVACVIAFAAPCAVITTMLAAEYDKDTDIAVGLVSLSTIASVITMPIIVAFAQYI